MFDRWIVDTGHLPAFLFLVSFVITFGFIRTSAHLIRAQVSWWPGNVEVGGTHYHHLVWGILLLLVAGYLGLVTDPSSPAHEIFTVLFGVGAGLTLDEFALWVELRDVYWEKEGRKSIDAVIVAAALAGFGVIGFSVWTQLAEDVATGVTAVVGVFGLGAIAMALICALKEKPWTAVASLALPLIGLVGAIRLAKPTSPWAKRFYRDGRLSRSRERFGGSALQSGAR